MGDSAEGAEGGVIEPAVTEVQWSLWRLRRLFSGGNVNSGRHFVYIYSFLFICSFIVFKLGGCYVEIELMGGNSRGAGLYVCLSMQERFHFFFT